MEAGNMRQQPRHPAAGADPLDSEDGRRAAAAAATGHSVFPPRNSMLAQLGHPQAVTASATSTPNASSYHQSFTTPHHRQSGLNTGLYTTSHSGQDNSLLSYDEAAARMNMISAAPPRGGNPSADYSMINIKRPDSVITTSSIVSSSDTAASEAGDSSAESTHGPPSAYAATGLYGPPKAAAGRQPKLPEPMGQELGVSVASVANSQQSKVLLSKTNSSDNRALSGAVRTHRRQISYPVTFRAGPCDGGGDQGEGGEATVVTAGSRAATGCPQQQQLPQQSQHCTVVRHGSNPINGHKRSHSYGHHIRPGGGCPGSQGHRRTGSSVIDTLQTLTCTSGAGGDGHYCQHHHEASLAKFLETLRKEQKEKCEKQELHLMQDELEDLRDCGIGACKPKFMQSLANIKVFVFLLSILVTMQQALSSGYLNSAITTIEKRYEIPSSISGIIASMYEIGNVITVIFVSYLGSRRHIPIFIGVGCLVMGIGSITFSFPHFLMGPYDVSNGGNANSSNICSRRELFTPSTGRATSETEKLLENIPGLDKFRDLAEGLSSPPLAPHNNQYNRENNCIEAADESSALPIFIFMIAQLLLGCGGSPLFTLGTTYIDNHVKRDSSAMYIGFMYSMCAFGPVCGFLLGAWLLSLHVDTFTADVSQFQYTSSTDRNWIGMWWGGFLIIGASLILISIPFFFFPKELKKEKVKVYIDEKYHHATDPSIRPPKKAGGASTRGSTPAVSKSSTLDNQMRASSAPKAAAVANAAAAAAAAAAHDAEEAAAETTYGKDIKDIPKSTWKLLTNKIYVVTCLGACTELIIVSGFIVFLPKYLETQFNLNKSMASMFTGGIAIPGACIGIFLGGYLLKRFQLRPGGAVQLVLFFSVLCLSCYALLFFFGCENVKMAGTTMPYSSIGGSNVPETPFKINLTASCNFGCECDMNDVQPVCGANGLTYFSPCHAGCTSVGTNNDNYTNCACVLNAIEDSMLGAPRSQMLQDLQTPLAASAGGESTTVPPGAPEVTMIPMATAGPCYTNCQMVMPFMVLLFFMTLVVAVTQMPVLMVVLRAVSEEEKAFALGIQFVIFRLFGYIPSPILFGHVIDSTCMLWKSTCEGEEGGRCLMYDIEMFRYKYVGVCCGIKVLSVIIFSLDWYLIRRRENEEKKQKSMTVGEIVNSIISLDKLFDPEGPMWVQVVDAENGDGGAGAKDGSVDTGSGGGGGGVDGIVVVPSSRPQLQAESPEIHSRTNFKHKFSNSSRRKSKNVVVAKSANSTAAARI